MLEPLPPLPGLTAATEWAIIFGFVFMGLDFLVGVVGACIRHDFKSAKVREGLGHKAMVALVIVLAITLEQASEVVGGLDFNVPITIPVCVLVIVMEVGSILETVKATYPDLENSGIFKLFDRTGDNDEDQVH